MAIKNLFNFYKFKSFMTIYDNCHNMTMYDNVWQCMTIYDNQHPFLNNWYVNIHHLCLLIQIEWIFLCDCCFIRVTNESNEQIQHHNN